MHNKRLLEGVQFILDNYGEVISNDKQLVLLYWQEIDGVEMDKESLSTVDYINKATNESDIIGAKLMLYAIEDGNPWLGID